jgi:hypothetical protein
MAQSQKTSLEIVFDGSAYLDDGAGGGPSLELSSKKPDDDTYVYFRAHGCEGCNLFSTSGQIVKSDSNLRKFTSEFVYFNNDTEARLRYPQAKDLEVEQMGKLIAPDGENAADFDSGKGNFLEPTPKSFVFDKAKNAIVSTVGPVYGVFLAEYTTPYDLYKATFAGSCPSIESADLLDVTQGNPDDDEAYQGRMPMIVFAERDGEIKASLNLSPPPCDNTGTTVGRSEMGDGAGPPQLKIEQDPQYPPRYAAQALGVMVWGPPRATCRLRLYPASAGTIKLNSGLVVQKEANIDAPATEIVTFNGSSSEKLRYQPKGSVAAYVVSHFRDIWGRTITPNVRLPGEYITVVQWKTRSTYTNPMDRRLEEDEIAIANPGGNAIPCYGTLEVKYVTTYDQWEMEFAWDSQRQWFIPAFAIAEPNVGDEGGTSQLINPPSARGAK